LGWDKEFNFEVPSEQPPKEIIENEDFQKHLHSILVKRQITEGSMICPNCERSYEIKNGIPNMLLNEDEI